LYRAAVVESAATTHAPAADGGPALWIAPVRGHPHPLSEIERRMQSLLRADPELAPLFCYNQLIETGRGTRYRVDLVWAEGKVVVELDGFADHVERSKFIADRHRDYDLMLDGYRVLRIAHDEIAQ